MQVAKNGVVSFKNMKEFYEFCDKRTNIVIEQARHKAAKDLFALLAPVSCTAIYEAYGFAEKRQEAFLDKLTEHLECIQDGVTTIDQYQDWCKEKNIKYFKVAEVHE